MTINPGEIIKQALEAAKPVAESLSDAWQGVVGDRVAAWRLKNAAKIQIKVREELDRLGLSLNLAHIPERYAFSWFEEATKQDEPEIQELFARLLARAAAGNADSADRRLLEIVSKLTPDDARMSQFFFDGPANCTMSKDGNQLAGVEIDEYELFKAARESYGKDSWRSIEHLISLGVLERRVAIDKDSVFNALSNLQTSPTGEVFPTWGSSHDLEIKTFVVSTTTGLALYRAVGT
ncbi:hypothetical protein F1640_06685 [Novosphingobium sp. NBM11]|uniref:Abi-alpha family protein n=1 Tax=Novosphingobium sp. NBM11 TaxID=2596914 RepID=UPI0018920D15|nr:hypothetical protein [Novosphingobium sp. NBM11]MBF5089702.1 hypothetical protein [Novosphingobium sp. NBM11]